MKKIFPSVNRPLITIVSLIIITISGCISFPGIRPTKFLAQEEIEDGKLKWYDVEGMVCRDGSQTGIGIKIKNTKKLAIYLNGGGACFNKPTCDANPSSFNEADMFDLYNSAKNDGIFDENNVNNPIGDWSVMFIPYCTGDVHMGTRWQGRALDISKPQAFVGAYNFEKAIIFIQSYFKKQGVEEILLFGISAGGYGVYTNFLKLKQYFSNVKITLINDSGPLINDMQVFNPIFQLGAVGIYGIIPPPGFFAPGFFDYGFTPYMHAYLSNRFPKDNFALVSSLEDNVIRYFLGFTYPNAVDERVPAEEFKQSLLNLRNDYLIPDTRWSTFYTKGDTHGQVQENDRFYENSSTDGTTLSEFVARIINGEQKLHVTVE